MRVRMKKDGSLLITADTVAEGFAIQATHPNGPDPQKIKFDMSVLGAPMAPNAYVSPVPVNDVLGYSKDEPIKNDTLEFDFNMADILVHEYQSDPISGFSTKRVVGIKVTHMPTKTDATCEDFKSSHMNRHMAFVRLEKKLKDK